MYRANTSAQTLASSSAAPPAIPLENILQDVMRILNRAGEDFTMHRRLLPDSMYQSLNVEYARLRSQAGIIASTGSWKGAIRLQREANAFEQLVSDEIYKLNDP